MDCRYCNQLCVKAGLRKNGMQKYFCKGCHRYQQLTYRSNACHTETTSDIRKLLVEGVGIRSIARILQISTTTVIRRIRQLARKISKPFSLLKGRIYELDELWTFVGSKHSEVWITYSIDRESKSIMDFKVGQRTKENIQQVTETVLSLDPLRVCTDGLITYRTLIPETIHRVGLPNTRHIERFNLTLRTHLKRLNRKTICFSKSKEMLEACLKIFFWGA